MVEDAVFWFVGPRVIARSGMLFLLRGWVVFRGSDLFRFLGVFLR